MSVITLTSTFRLLSFIMKTALYKICHMTSVHSRFDTRIYYKYCQATNEQYNTSFIVADGKGFETINDIDIHDVGKSEGRLARIFTTTNRVYKKALEIDADLYHFHDPELIPVGLKLKKLNKKVIYDVHEDVPQDILTKEWIPFSFRKLLSKSFDRYEKKASHKFDFVIAATPVIKTLFNTEFLEYISNYPILKEREIDYDVKVNNLCFIGLLTEYRGVYQMVKVANNINAKFDVAGPFSQESVFAQAKNMKGWDKINYLGEISASEAQKLRDKSSIGVIVFLPSPNLGVAYPNKFYEYMEAGMAIICTNFDHWKAIVEKHDCGICVDPFNIDEFTQAINKLTSDKELCKRMGQNARALAMNEFNWSKDKEKILNIYNQLMPTN